MADIKHFPGRNFASMDPERQRAIASNEPRFRRPVHGGHPTPMPVSHTASQQVVQALKFYAAGGFDHGDAARKALIAMNTAIEANHQTT